jgi:hypothetical protein
MSDETERICCGEIARLDRGSSEQEIVWRSSGKQPGFSKAEVFKLRLDNYKSTLPLIQRIMEQQTSSPAPESNGDHQGSSNPSEGLRQPKKRFVGRRTADAQASKDASSNGTIENGGALQKGKCC